MSDQLTPQSTHAVVVGIERYSAGPTWNLDGPASDAVRFMEFLNGCSVPAANIHALLSPLPENLNALNTRAKACTSNAILKPTTAVIYDLVTQTLPLIRTDLLFFFWAGHGIITVEGQRRLFTEDAETGDKRNLDLNDLLAALRTHKYPGLNRQALIVDTCASYAHNPSISLPTIQFPKGDALPGREQFAIFAAAPGEYAKNLNVEKAGLLSRELLSILTAESLATGAAIAWPPDLMGAAQRLAQRFTELRRNGATKQTPTTFWFRDWGGSEQNLAQMSITVSDPHFSARLPRKLTIEERKAFLDAMLSVNTLKDAVGRQRVKEDLRSEIATNISRGSTDRFDLMAFLDTSRRYRNGLSELLSAVSVYELDSDAMVALVALAHQILPDEVPSSLD